MNTIKPLHLRGAEVDTLIGIGKTTRFSWQDPKSPYYDPTWPLPIRLGTRKTVYIADEVEAWLKARPRTREIHNESSTGVYTEQHFEARNRIATGVTK